MGDESYSAAVTDVTIENIIFNNIYVRFYGPYKRRMAIRYNVFINTNRAGEQLAVSHIPYEVRGNVLMRGPNYPGLGLSTYANKVINGRGLLVEGNFLGSPDQRQRASTYVDNKTGALIDRVLQLRKDGRLSFSDDQGNYVAGWYATSQLQGAVFRRNYFAGNTLRKLWNPKTGEEDIQRDHNIYLKEYNGVDIVQNYFSGWPDQPAGQLKFRNAQNLVFAANYLDGISFNARPYDNSLLMFMRDTYIFNNVLKQIEVNHKPSESLVSYWQNFTDSPSAKIDVRDYLVFSNRFAAADKATCRVTAPKVTLSPGQFLAADNRYADGSAVASCGSVRESTVEQMKARLPQAKHKYLALQPIEPGMANDWPASDPAVKQ
ncbi:hypothetical protein QS306_03550 [Paraburkholderia bonniea]|nr:hypothetical protein [Paraburkholderia bonniea]WJF90751.1 hypothetical protein QS306_03550 [Paraburkholderia bonniea]WJF94065.1 hypothetical protein QS308_03550 [Paraburkholderia bonniea]